MAYNLKLCTEYGYLQSAGDFSTGASLGQKDIKEAKQTKAQCLVIFLIPEGALRGVEGKKATRFPPIAQPWGLSTLSNFHNVKPSESKSASEGDSFVIHRLHRLKN